jgi:hypothetical protein
LTQLAKAGTNSLRVLQELVGTLVNASFLQIVGRTNRVSTVKPKRRQLKRCMNTNLLGCDALGCEIIDAVVEAALDQVAIQSKEILHLIKAHQRLIWVLRIQQNIPESSNTYLLVLNHLSDLGLLGLVITSEIHGCVDNYKTWYGVVFKNSKWQNRETSQKSSQVFRVPMNQSENSMPKKNNRIQDCSIGLTIFDSNWNKAFITAVQLFMKAMNF